MVLSYSVVQVIATRFDAGQDIESDFDDLFFPDEDIFTDSENYILREPAVGYWFKAVGDWTAPFSSPWDDEVSMCGITCAWDTFGPAIEKKTRQMMANKPTFCEVTFVLFAEQKFVQDEDGGDCWWTLHRTCELSELWQAFTGLGDKKLVDRIAHEIENRIPGESHVTAKSILKMVARED